MIAVIGGGLIGASVAFELGQAGADVVVLDADLPGAAWRAGAGMLTPTGERLAGSPLEDLAARSLGLWPDFARRLAQASGLPVPFEPGVELTDYGASDEPPGSICRVPHEATTHPPSVVRAALHGLDLRHTEVLSVEVVRGGVRVQTSAGPLLAEQAVLAAGAWAGRFGLPVTPVRGQAALLGPAGLGAAPPLPARYTAKARGFPLYGLPRIDGLYVGATVRPGNWHAGPLEADARWLERAAPRLWPGAQLAGLGWGEPGQPGQPGPLGPGRPLVGLRPVTPSGLPIVEAPEVFGGRVVVAAGHGRHGALLAPVTAQRVAELLL